MRGEAGREMDDRGWPVVRVSLGMEVPEYRRRWMDGDIEVIRRWFEEVESHVERVLESYCCLYILNV